MYKHIDILQFHYMVLKNKKNIFSKMMHLHVTVLFVHHYSQEEYSEMQDTSSYFLHK